MEIDGRLRREIEKRLELAQNKQEIEATEIWLREIEAIYRKKYESLAAVQAALKGLMERMGNRITVLKRAVREES